MKVCIIGAGVAGICAMKSLLRLRDELEFVVYEQSNRVGGVWIYEDPYKPTNMYKNLRTNIPKESSDIPGHPILSKSDSDPSFISHTEYLKYLEDMVEQLDLVQYIQFRTRVENVEPVEISDTTQYKVTVKNLQSGEHNSQLFDSLIICNGHHNIPRMPQIKGSETFTDKIRHTIDYREPEPYTNKTVVVLGARASGTDITGDLAPFAAQVYLAHKDPPLPTIFPANVEQKSAISHIEHSDIHFTDGSVVKNVDELLLATGYLYEFPFLADSLQPKIRNRALFELYKMVADINNPNIFYIGLNSAISCTAQFYVQCEYMAAVLAQEAILPSRQEMEAENKERYDRLVTTPGKTEDQYHYMPIEQWDYNKELMLAAGKKPLGGIYQNLFNTALGLRVVKCRVDNFFTGIYRRTDDDNFVTIYQPPPEV